MSKIQVEKMNIFKIFNKGKDMDQQILDQIRQRQNQQQKHMRQFIKCMLDDMSLVNYLNKKQVKYIFQYYLAKQEQTRKDFQRFLKSYIGVK